MTTLREIAIKSLVPILIGAGLFASLSAGAQTIVRITAVPTPSGIVSSKFRDGDDGGAAPPTAPELGILVPVDEDSIDIPLLTACTLGTAPLAYEIEASSTNEFTGFAVVEANADFSVDGIYTLIGLNASTTYWVRSTCVDDDGRRSASSSVRSAATLAEPDPGDVTAPTSPTNKTCTSTVHRRVDCTFTASTDAVGVTEYDVLLGAGDGNGAQVGNGSIVTTLVGTPPDTSFQLNNVVPPASGEVYVRVRARDAALNVSAYDPRDFLDVFEDPPPEFTPLGGTGFEEFSAGFTFTGANTPLAYGLSASCSASSGDCPVVVTSPVYKGSNAVRYKIPHNNSGALTSNFRSELTFTPHWGSSAGAGDPVNTGVEQCIGLAYFLESIPINDQSSTVINQTHTIGGQPGFSPATGLRLQQGGDDYDIELESGDDFDGNTTRTHPQDHGEYHTLVQHIKWNTSSTGFIDTYIDGVLLKSITNIFTLAPGTTEIPFFKNGLYASRCDNGVNCTERVMYVDELYLDEGADCPASVDPENH